MIGKPIERLDVHDKSTGRAVYAIDVKVDGMLHAAVQHAPRLGMSVGDIHNEDAVKVMKGVHSVHRLPGAVAVVAERWWHAKRAAEALQVEWNEAGDKLVIDGIRVMPADFSTTAFRERLQDGRQCGGRASRQSLRPFSSGGHKEQRSSATGR